ncbi:MAG: hypothetical protein HN348_34970, partial [Proteobacteria bacterium]|nr:hypothetical protein [Pseudomonadota bacterium]
MAEVTVKSPLSASLAHDSAHLHVTGAARYIDDMPMPEDGLVAMLLSSPHPHARIIKRDATNALEVDGVECIAFADHIP